ncbi:hypothetical protein GF322_05150, partial [Candidatus Dependentiae bacterium]|nr:hypothetical protein [Candidatus Dependentiae bacterium]
GFDSSDDEGDVQMQQEDSRDEFENQEAANEQQVEEFNLLMEKLKTAIYKLNETKQPDEFQAVTTALSIIKQNPEYIKRKSFLRQIDLERVCIGGQKDLSFADLRGIDLTRFDLSNTILIGTNLSGANLSEANLDNSIICDANLSNSKLNATQLKKAKIINSDFSHSIINEVRTDHVLILNQTKFNHAKLINSKFKDSIIKNVNFMNAIFNNFKFDSSTIENTNMRNIKAEGISFISTPLKMVSFVLAQIKGLYIFGSGILGDQLDFKYAYINKGCVLGGENTKSKVSITELEDYYFNDKRNFDPFKTEIIKYDLAGSKVETILFNIDFHGVKMEDVYFSNILFPSILNVSKSKIFIGCIFNDIVTNLNNINTFTLKGAHLKIARRSNNKSIYERVQSEIDRLEFDLNHDTHHIMTYFMLREEKNKRNKILEYRIDYPEKSYNEKHANFDFIWKKTDYESYMQKLMQAIVNGSISGLFQITLTQLI